MSLALAFGPDPDLLILDDPTLGLDTVVRRDFLESIIHLIQRGTHDFLQLAHPGRRRARGRPDRHPCRRRAARRLPDRPFQDRGAAVVLEFVGSAAFSGLPGAGQPAASRRPAGAGHGDYGPEHAEIAEGLGATNVEVMEMNLEDAFIAYTRGETAALPTIEWEVAQ